MKYVAQYVDCAGNSFSAPVTKLPNGQWVLATANGPREISYYIYGNDLAGGYATFRDFRLDDVPKNLRGCDYFELRNQMYKTLPWPQKLPTSPIPQTQPDDTQLHIERLPGESSFGALQRAYAEQGIAAQRKQRQVARTEAQNTPIDPREVAAAMRVNAEYAALRRPRGRGQFIVNGE